MTKTIKVEFKLEVDENIRQSDVFAWVRAELQGSLSCQNLNNPLRHTAMFAIPGSVKIHWLDDKE